MCKPCPLFSNTSAGDVATVVCQCDEGYYRPSDGSEDAMRCTREYTCTHNSHRLFTIQHLKEISFTAGPPSAPQNLLVLEVTNNSVFITWEDPKDDGGRTDLFYIVSNNVTNRVFTTIATNAHLTGLISSFQYEIRVTANNGVSHLDNNDERTVNITIMTEGGGICLSVCLYSSGCVHTCMHIPLGHMCMYSGIYNICGGSRLLQRRVQREPAKEACTEM